MCFAQLLRPLVTQLCLVFICGGTTEKKKKQKQKQKQGN
jgi:hypothetical protein